MSWFTRLSSPSSTRRRGVVAVQMAVMATALFGFAVLVIDLSRMFYTKGQLQRAADSAALAGASAYFSDARLAGYEEGVAQMVRDRSQSYSIRNPSLGKDTILEVADIATGTHDFSNPTGPLTASEKPNAVELFIRRTAESENGPIPFLFAGIFGRQQGSLVTRARAAMDDRFAGFRAGDGGFLPFTIHRLIHEDMVANGPDDWSVNDADGDGEYTVTGSPDGVHEIKLFPWKDQAVEAELSLEIEGAGNFGTLNIGVTGVGTAEVEEQILNGITAEQLEAAFGTTELVFYDEVDGPNTYEAPGNPGVSVGMRDAVEARIGDFVGYFIHDYVVDNGSTAVYTLSGLGFGRIVHIKLTGGPQHRTLTIQPVAYAGGDVIISPGAPSSGGLVGRIVLVQ